MKTIFKLLAAATMLSSCYVHKGLPCPCMHCEKGVKNNHHIQSTAQKKVR